MPIPNMSLVKYLKKNNCSFHAPMLLEMMELTIDLEKGAVGLGVKDEYQQFIQIQSKIKNKGLYHEQPLFF